MNQDDPLEMTAGRRAVAPCLVALLIGSLLGVSWQVEGLLAAQRVMLDLVMPVGIAWLASLYAAIRFRVLRRRSAAAAYLLIFVAISLSFSPLVGREMTRRTEASPPAIFPLDAKAPTYRSVVVLGGGASLGPDGQPQLSTDGHRIAMAAQLWYAGKTETIICTGEDNFVPGEMSEDEKIKDQRDLHHPARLGVDLLVSLGVPRDRLFRIKGINTTAELKNLSEFLKSPPAHFPDSGPVGLITSAFHIPRAMRLAERESLELTPIPVCYRTGLPEPIRIADWVPTVQAGSQIFIVGREWLAWAVGR